MKRIYKISLFSIVSLALLSGCVKDPSKKIQPGDPQRIMFYSSVEEAVLENDTPETKAPTPHASFPNKGSIGVLISTDITSTDPDDIDWTQDYVLEDKVTQGGNIGGKGDKLPANSEAIATTKSGLVYRFEWAVAGNYYWPFLGTPLRFMAYAPHLPKLADAGTSKFYISDDFRKINIELDGCTLPATPSKTPDVMYVAPPKDGVNNFEKKIFNKVDKFANLGAFDHALSQLVVVVNNGANITVALNKLEVTVGTTKATLDLMNDDHDTKLTLAAPASQATATYKFVSAPITMSGGNKVLTYSALLLPGTHDDVELEFILKDSTYDAVTYNRDLTDFKVSGVTPVTLKRGHTTIVTINIKGVTPADAVEIDLKGQLTKWIDAGDINFGVIK